MNEILKMLNALSADELDSVIMRAKILLEKKRKEEAEAAQRERQRQELLAQERRRQAEIAELQRKLRELQNQKANVPKETSAAVGSNFVMYDAPKPVSPQPQAVPRPSRISCPYCHTMNPAGSQFCESCGRKLSAPAPTPQAAPRPSGITCPHCRHLNKPGSIFCESCGQKLTGGQASWNSAPRSGVFYADESMKKWELRPGESSLRGRHEIMMLHPDGGKFAYYMEVTNQRILFSRESSTAKNVGMAARMGGGLVGSLIAESVKAAAGSGPKPWLAIPLTAISNCGLQNKKEFFIVADQTYVLRNKNYDTLLPDLIAKAK